jgi:hypothetical protein
MVIYSCRCIPTWLSSYSRSPFDEAPSLRSDMYRCTVVETVRCVAMTIIKIPVLRLCGRSRRGADRGTGVSMQGGIMLSVNIAWGAARILRVGSKSWGDLPSLISKD